jgi:peptidyl-prolyl cis-trans isomerase B (cyclophilin B)
VPTPHLDGKHAIFGAVVGAEDQEVVDAIEGGDSIDSLTIEGDTAELLAAHQDRVDEWNSALG